MMSDATVLLPWHIATTNRRYPRETANAPAQEAAPAAPSDWAVGKFSCFDDMGLCCITYFVPCLTFGKLTTSNQAWSKLH